MMKIFTSHASNIFPQYQWGATLASYEPGSPIGYGRTEEEAVSDLLEKLGKRNSDYLAAQVDNWESTNDR